jgi:hypothetical protein
MNSPSLFSISYLKDRPSETKRSDLLCSNEISKAHKNGVKKTGSEKGRRNATDNVGQSSKN